MILRSRLLRRLYPSVRRHALSSEASARTPTHPSVPTTPKPSAVDTIYYDVSNLAVAGISASLVCHFLFTYVVEVSPCFGVSMIPTISLHGDWVVVNKWHRHGRGIKVGDVVDYVKPTEPALSVVKRVIGMPGDFVVGNYVDPGEERKSPLRLVSRGEDDDDDGGGGGGGLELVLDRQESEKMMLQVPEGHCWMVGDNLSQSRDSRLYGPVPLALIKGKVVAKILPFSDAGWIRNNVHAVEKVD